MKILLAVILAVLPLALGEGNIEKRVINGEPAPPQLYPWAVSIKISIYRSGQVSNFCGATLISQQWLVTAAHCLFFHPYRGAPAIDLRDPRRFHVQAGNVFIDMGYEEPGHYLPEETYVPNWQRNNVPDWQRNQQNGRNPSNKRYHFHIIRVVSHPQYSPGLLEYDIALLKLSRALPLYQMPELATITLPAPYLGTWWPALREQCIMVGWGCTRGGGPPVPRSNLARLEVMSNQDCSRYYNGRAGLNPQHEFCAGFYGRNMGVCPGDSGSGLVCKRAGVWTLAGVVSAAHTARPGQYPGIFTRVSHFEGWIRQTIRY